MAAKWGKIRRETETVKAWMGMKRPSSQVDMSACRHVVKSFRTTVNPKIERPQKHLHSAGTQSPNPETLI